MCGPTAGRRRFTNIAAVGPTVTRWAYVQRADVGLPLECEQSRRRPDSDPMGIRTEGRRRVTTWMPTKYQSIPSAARPRADGHSDFGFSTSSQCQVCLAIDRQINNTHQPSWHLTDAVLLTLGRCCADIGLIHLCQHPGDVVLAATVSFQCIADKELTSPWWQRPAMTMKCGPQEKKQLKNKKHED